MKAPTEFWGVEVKVGQSLKVDSVEPLDGYIHISKVALGEAKQDRASEPVVLYLKVDDQNFVLGTLSRDDIPHLSLGLVLHKEFELSHVSKNASVYFTGYKIIRTSDDGGVSNLSDSGDDLALMDQENGAGAGAASGKAARAGGKPSVKAKNLQFYKKTTQKSKSHAGTSRKAQADISNSGKQPPVPDLMKNNKTLMKPSESPSPSEIAADFLDDDHSNCICRQQLSGRGRFSEDDDVLFKSL